MGAFWPFYFAASLSASNLEKDFKNGSRCHFFPRRGERVDICKTASESVGSRDRWRSFKSGTYRFWTCGNFPRTHLSVGMGKRTCAYEWGGECAVDCRRCDQIFKTGDQTRQYI